MNVKFNLTWASGCKPEQEVALHSLEEFADLVRTEGEVIVSFWNEKLGQLPEIKVYDDYVE
jgi:hypothetical protein